MGGSGRRGGEEGGGRGEQKRDEGERGGGKMGGEEVRNIGRGSESLREGMD